MEREHTLFSSHTAAQMQSASLSKHHHPETIFSFGNDKIQLNKHMCSNLRHTKDSLHNPSQWWFTCTSSVEHDSVLPKQ